MDQQQIIEELLAQLEGSLAIHDGSFEVKDPTKLSEKIHVLAEVSALESGSRQSLARYLTRLAAVASGIYLSSIHDLYMARGRGEVPSTFTVPAMNLRSLPFDAARAVFRVAKSMQAGAFIFEIARSEMGYTDQRPSEYATSILAAGIAEGYKGPVFIQGDHFQVSPKRFASDPDTELQAVRDLTSEAIKAGFYNIDVDTSTLVDLSKETIPEQQALNCQLSAMYTALIRSLEPDQVTISVGGEIGEVGGHNSTEQELRGYMEGYKDALMQENPDATGLSKISVQTGTSHGGVVLPDGSIKKVSVDFNTLQQLSRIAREDFGLAGAVQHGASTLPESAFHKFVESEACEVHLATNFQNILFDRLSDDLREEMYAYLDEKHVDERKPDMTDEQFYYKSRKRALGPFKTQLWRMDKAKKEEISQAWEDQFRLLFELLSMQGSKEYVEQTIKTTEIKPDIKDYLADTTVEKEVKDLAD
jgi:fructose/tagatose bisphosphate aldolase